jgi:hypothetical protein
MILKDVYYISTSFFNDFFVTTIIVLVEAFVIYQLLFNYYNYDYSQLPKKQKPIQPQILPCTLPKKSTF